MGKLRKQGAPGGGEGECEDNGGQQKEAVRHEEIGNKVQMK